MENRKEINEIHKIIMKPIMPTKRIEYIDAMRGFTMLLVVMAHVVTFGLGGKDDIVFYFSDIFQTFRMPLFFFVSGFVFYVADKKWTKEDLLMFFQKKIPVQILSPFIFFIIFTLFKNYNIIYGLIDSTKYGYWFTFTLFSYFVFYLCAFYICKLFRFSSILFDIILCLLGLGMFMFMREKYIGDSIMATTLGLGQCKYFIFFCLGTLSRKHFSSLEGLLDKIWFLPLMIITFALLTLFPIYEIISSRVNALLLGTAGIIIVFATFRHYQETFCSKRK